MEFWIITGFLAVLSIICMFIAVKLAFERSKNSFEFLFIGLILGIMICFHLYAHGFEIGRASFVLQLTSQATHPTTTHSISREEKSDADREMEEQMENANRAVEGLPPLHKRITSRPTSCPASFREMSDSQPSQPDDRPFLISPID
jgi:hypothetical protein